MSSISSVSVDGVTYSIDAATLGGGAKSDFVPQSSLKSLLLNYIYPVGSIYMSVNSTSPASFLGGTWTQLQNRFLLGAGSSYSNGATGGESTHTLSESELPNITGSFSMHGGEYGSVIYNVTGCFSGNAISSTYKTNSDLSAHTGAYSQRSVNLNIGGGAAHNNMPPYLVVYMWKRTA